MSPSWPSWTICLVARYDSSSTSDQLGDSLTSPNLYSHRLENGSKNFRCGLEADLATTFSVVRMSTEIGFSHMTCLITSQLLFPSPQMLRFAIYAGIARFEWEPTNSKSKARHIRGAWVTVAVEIKTDCAPPFFMQSSGSAKNLTEGGRFSAAHLSAPGFVSHTATRSMRGCSYAKILARRAPSRPRPINASRSRG